MPRPSMPSPPGGWPREPTYQWAPSCFAWSWTNGQLRVPVPERYTGVVKGDKRSMSPSRPTADRSPDRSSASIPPSTRRRGHEGLGSRAEQRPTTQARQLCPWRSRRMSIAEATTVPLESIVTFAGVTKIFLVEDGKAREVQVTTGAGKHLDGSDWAFDTGGQLVVTSGQSVLADGSTVKFVSRSLPRNQDQRLPAQPAPTLPRVYRRRVIRQKLSMQATKHTRRTRPRSRTRRNPVNISELCIRRPSSPGCWSPSPWFWESSLTTNWASTSFPKSISRSSRSRPSFRARRGRDGNQCDQTDRRGHQHSFRCR